MNDKDKNQKSQTSINFDENTVNQVKLKDQFTIENNKITSNNPSCELIIQKINNESILK